MFTGLVECQGMVTSITKQPSVYKLEIKPFIDNFDCDLGDSIAVNGACLTVAQKTNDGLLFDLSHETVSLTAFSQLLPRNVAAAPVPVNLERAMKMGARLGGHLVSGHIDGCGMITKVSKESDWEVYITLPKEFAHHVIPKGSITIDGVSLTVNSIEDLASREAQIRLTLIPTTLEKTTLSAFTEGQQVNIELDMVAKYLERFNSLNKNTKGPTQ